MCSTMLTTWHYLHSPAIRCAAVHHAALISYRPGHGQTDRRTPYCFIDPAPHTMRIMPITYIIKTVQPRSLGQFWSHVTTKYTIYADETMMMTLTIITRVSKVVCQKVASPPLIPWFTGTKRVCPQTETLAVEPFLHSTSMCPTKTLLWHL